MSLLSLLNQGVEVFVPTFVSSGFGDATKRTYSSTPTWTGRGRLTLTSGLERTDLRDVTLETWTLDLAPSAPVDHTCIVRVDDRWYEVRAVYPARGRTSAIHHFVCQVEAYSGHLPDSP